MTPVVESGGETRLELQALARTGWRAHPTKIIFSCGAMLTAAPESLIKRTFAILCTKISEEFPKNHGFYGKHEVW